MSSISDTPDTLGPEGETFTWHPFTTDVEVHTVTWPDGRTAATLFHNEVDQEVTAADLRALADTWEAYPAWLRALADELEARA
jgi:hypothetical protein